EERGRKGIQIKRFKGLGEMNAEELWETTMNPDGRTLLQVRVEDEVQTDELFSTLMGDQVEPRRDCIEKIELRVKNVDIWLPLANELRLRSAFGKGLACESCRLSFRLMRMDRMTTKAQEAVREAVDLASRRGNPELYPEHLIRAILSQEGG